MLIVVVVDIGQTLETKESSKKFTGQSSDDDDDDDHHHLNNIRSQSL
jgi:hypothetical protein